MSMPMFGSPTINYIYRFEVTIIEKFGSAVGGQRQLSKL